VTSDPTPHGPGSDDDAWRDLVARLGGGGTGDEAEGPAPRELSAAERGAAGPGGFSRFDPLGLSGGGRHARGHAPAAGEPEAELPGDFVPEEPEPVLAGADPVSVIAWCGAVGGPVALLTCALVWRSVPGFVVALLVAAFVAGVGTLIMRLPGSKDEGDDGARL
jgi:hypothetical protein